MQKAIEFLDDGTVCLCYVDYEHGTLIARKLIAQVTLEEFKILLSRAMNTWERTSPDMRIFVDTILHGKPLQDYRSFPRYIPIEESRPTNEGSK